MRQRNNLEPELAPIPEAKDAYGCALDWSGVTCVVVCHTCDWRGGPWFSLAEGAADARHHKRQFHTARCTEPGCRELAQGQHGLCKLHYGRTKYGPSPRCRIEECQKVVHKRGMCTAHWSAEYEGEYSKAARLSQKPPSVRKVKARCSDSQCDRELQAKGMCTTHYMREYHARRRAGLL